MSIGHPSSISTSPGARSARTAATVALSLCSLLFCLSVRGEEAAYVPGEVLVKFRGSTSAVGVSRVLAARTGDIRLTERLHSIRLNPGETLEQTVADMAALPEVEYAQPNYISRVQTVPDDPLFGQQWALSNPGVQFGGIPGDADVRATAAWDLTTGSRNVIVALIDTGVDLANPELRDNLWNGPNGAAGYDFVDGDADPQDGQGHGTALAAVLAGRGNNDQGIAGLSWQLSLMVLRSLNTKGTGTTAQIVPAIEYAIQHGARIINASFGKDQFDQAEFDAINDARKAGVLVVAAACNDGKDNDAAPVGGQGPCYPASYDLDNIISVAATDHTDALISQSNYGKTSVDLGAPGFNILTLAPSGSSCILCYVRVTGTSISAAYVSGAAALVLAYRPGLTAPGLREAILRNVDPSDKLKDVVATGGRLNVAAALASDASVQLDGGSDGGRADKGGGGGGGAMGPFTLLLGFFPIVVLRRRRMRSNGARRSGTAPA